MRLDGIILLDHENIPFDKISLYQLIQIWLDTIAERATMSNVLTVSVRAYGGWYQGDVTTEARYRAAAMYADECPSLLMHRSRYCRLAFEFADELLDPRLQSPRDRRSPKVTNTVVSRTSSPFFTRRPNAPECNEPDCQLRAIRMWMRRRRACTKPGCPQAFDSQFQRFAQKQVDIHLASDCGHRAIVNSRIAPS